MIGSHGIDVVVVLLVVLCNSIGARGPIGYAGTETRVYIDLVFFPLRFRGVTNMYWEWVGGGK